MRDYKEEFEKRTAWIRKVLEESGAGGIVYGNSGGKDSALAGILCKAACDNTLGVIMPCASKRNYGEDTEDALAVAKQFDIETITVDLTETRETLLKAVEPDISEEALKNIAPRLRMTTVYALAQTRGALVCGTGNRDEIYVGYFTKWGDGASDLNPIGDLTVGEIYEFLDWLDAPLNIRKKAPSAGLYEGQTDESEMGISYAALDEYILTGNGDQDTVKKIDRMHSRSEHKRSVVRIYPA